ncbi:MAG: aminotransferase class III-fold pyridoxal phosphate-dependent enzyme [Chloroflexota bacterium]|nr:aminotransferase class III-fold pyridoxal phosphate-dependent enzyme [Chloroflexota bacterium]
MTNAGNIIEEYKLSHPGSQKLHERAVRSFAADGATHATRMLDPFRPYITHAQGSRKWDVDGNEYIDYVMGHGSLILGHCHPDVVQAVQEQAAKGFHYGENHELEVKWAELIKKLMPSAERVEFVACGNEANALAIRFGRIFTGRKKVLRLEEHFHGWFDFIAYPGTPGVLPEDNEIGSVYAPNDLDIIEKELAKGEYAVLMTEGGGAHMEGQYPLERDFVHGLRDLTRKYGTIWVIDEVVTGFRYAPGGWQSEMGVTPDLTTLGKCVGGGLSIGAVVGRSDIMDVLSSDTPPQQRIIHTGTWNGNPMVSAAGVAACKLYLTGEPQRKAAEAGALLRAGLNEALRERGISGAVYGKTMLHSYLGPREFEPASDMLPPTKDINKLCNPAMAPTWDRMLIHLLQRGVANMGGRLYVMSAAHTEEDIEQTIQAFSESLDAMIAEGSLHKS